MAKIIQIVPLVVARDQQRTYVNVYGLDKHGNVLVWNSATSEWIKHTDEEMAAKFNEGGAQ